MRRHLKVYKMTEYENANFPRIILQGKWVQDLGFAIGDGIEVICIKNRIIINKTTTKIEKPNYSTILELYNSTKIIQFTSYCPIYLKNTKIFEDKCNGFVLKLPDWLKKEFLQVVEDRTVLLQQETDCIYVKGFQDGLRLAVEALYI